MSALPSIAPQLERPPAADATADLYARHSARIFGYCLGCKMFALLMRVGVIPASVCAECADVGRRLRTA